MENQTITVTGISNREFIERYARPGCIGLCGGVTRIDLAIRVAQRHLHAEHRSSDWSHAFVFEGRRLDGHHWVLESDIQILRRNIQLGVQENRADKYFDAAMFPTLAVLDFGLGGSQVEKILHAGLDLVARHERYSLRELIGTLLVLKKQELRAQENRLAQERSVYCSAMVKQLYLAAGLDIAPGIAGKNTAPHDCANSPLPHVKYLLLREIPLPPLAALAKRIRTRVRKIKGGTYGK